MTSREEAAGAAAKSGVLIRELHEIGEFTQVYRLFEEIWRPDPGNAPVAVEMMIGFAHTGNYVAGAYEGEVLVGASVGYRAAGGSLHSHVTGAAIGRGIGYALKLHQRAWCLERGLDRITWTFDPLVRRNARFNLVKLGARPEEYLRDFYGVMADAINEGDSSDRLLAVWPLDERPVEARSEPAEGRVRVLEEAGPGPVERPAVAVVVLVGTPHDVERLRREDPAAARAWRAAVRKVLGGLMEAGGRVDGFTDRGDYVVSLTG
ncbi:GNAT family N-acetyltransferase [Nonomuraea sp. WAC 01424]|uniref:GNAT family N-acetyltransferase n=1 Tax=Nonomuraea sp. WAC 01424 TaxID=2203200 RepID=UPI000F77F012|nr:GNAT family N-acetyltransferase [Nonomuraea sp. WAC 01424]RSM97679.1 GNAT family N-acetyltransferase [Nonomuraea sp. WAC 01424]